MEDRIRRWHCETRITVKDITFLCQKTYRKLSHGHHRVDVQREEDHSNVPNVCPIVLGNIVSWKLRGDFGQSGGSGVWDGNIFTRYWEID